MSGFIRAAIVLHLAVKPVLILHVEGLRGSEAVMEFFPEILITLLCYISWRLWQSDKSNIQKRLVFYAMGVWLVRGNVDYVSQTAADMLSLSVAWLFLRSQTHVLNLSQRVLRWTNWLFGFFELGLLVFGVAKQLELGPMANVVHTVLFTSSHLLFLAMIFWLYGRAAVITRDPTLKARFFLMMLAAVMYVGLFVSDFLWRLIAPGTHGNLPYTVKELFEVLGMMFLYEAFNMTDRARSFILLWYHAYSGQMYRRLISLVLYMSEVAAREQDHILPVLAVRTAKRMGATAAEQRIIRQASAVLCVVHRHELPDMHQQRRDQPAQVDAAHPALSLASPFESRLQELERVEMVLNAVDLPYEVYRHRYLLEAEILRVVFAYLTGATPAQLQAAAGADYLPEAVNALVEEVALQPAVSVPV